MGEAIFIDSQGSRHQVDVPDGWSLMEAARAEDLDGIVGECGGGAICGTCHVQVGEDWYQRIPETDPMEQSMLTLVPERVGTSRLSCQIFMNGDLDGICVQIPTEQLDY